MADAVIPWGGGKDDVRPTRYLVYATNKNTGKQHQVPVQALDTKDIKKIYAIRYPNDTIDRVARAQKQYVGWTP